MTTAQADFRTRAAAARRGRMRQRLLDAVMASYAPDGRGERAVIDDVVTQAGVSRGTFYKYFPTLEAAVAELGRRNADDMMTTLAEVFGEEDDPALRAIGGPILALTRAAMDPRWAGFTARVDYVEHLAQPTPLYAIVSDSLAQARAAGGLNFTSLVVATDLAIGVTVQGTRRLAHGQQCDRAYVEELAVAIMAGLGMDPDAARQLASRAWTRIVAAAPGLAWWRAAPFMSG